MHYQPKILSCGWINIWDLHYHRTDLATVKHPWKESFGIENYNCRWFDKQPPPSTESSLITYLCHYSLLHPIEAPSNPETLVLPRPDTLWKNNGFFSLRRRTHIVSMPSYRYRNDPNNNPVFSCTMRFRRTAVPSIPCGCAFLLCRWNVSRGP